MACVIIAGAEAEAESSYAFCLRTRTRLVLQLGFEPKRHDARIQTPSSASVMAARPWALSWLGAGKVGTREAHGGGGGRSG